MKNNENQRKSIKINAGICWDIQACAMEAYASKGPHPLKPAFLSCAVHARFMRGLPDKLCQHMLAYACVCQNLIVFCIKC
jgi:hypothetical protein